MDTLESLQANLDRLIAEAEEIDARWDIDPEARREYRIKNQEIFDAKRALFQAERGY